LDLLKLLLNLSFNFIPVVEVAGHGSMGCCGEQIGVLTANFIDGLAVGEIVHGNLGYPDAEKTLRNGGLIGVFCRWG